MDVKVSSESYVERFTREQKEAAQKASVTIQIQPDVDNPVDNSTETTKGGRGKHKVAKNERGKS